MASSGTASPLVAGVALLERAIGYTLGSLVLVTPADLSRDTPCVRWDLRMLLAHMNDSLLALTEATTGRVVTLEPVQSLEHPVAAVTTLRDRACRLLGDWSRGRAADGAEGAGTGRTEQAVSVGGLWVTSSLVAAAGALEVAVHGWDVAYACGRPRALPPPLAAELLGLAPLLVRPADRCCRFASPVGTGPRAHPGDRLVAFLGRDPGWTPR
jgi:uncharacterized protein (TIGR03086 family)